MSIRKRSTTSSTDSSKPSNIVFPARKINKKKLSEILRIAYSKREEIFLASSNNSNSNRSSKRKSDSDNDPKSSNKRRKTDNN